MKKFQFVFALVGLLFVLNSCKNESKQENLENLTSEELSKRNPAPKKELTTEDKKFLASVSNKIMITPDTKEFARQIVGCQMVDFIADIEGSVTVFAPSNSAFLSLSDAQKKFISHVDNKQAVANAIKNHIVTSNYDSTTLYQALKGGKSIALNTLGGVVLKAQLVNDTIIVFDPNNKKAKLIKSDIVGGNGVVHVIDQLLFVD